MASSRDALNNTLKSLADYLPETETENKNNQEGKPQPTVRKQYSYSNDDGKPSPLQSKDTSVRQEKHPPDPEDEKTEEKLYECKKEKKRLIAKFSKVKEGVFQELTNTPTNDQEIKRHIEDLRYMKRNWQINAENTLKLCANSNKSELARETKRDNEIFNYKIDELIQTLQGMDEEKKFFGSSNFQFSLPRVNEDPNIRGTPNHPPTSRSQSFSDRSYNQQPRRKVLSLDDSMMTGKEFTDNDTSTIIGGAKKKIFPTNQKPSGILKQPSINVTSTSDELEEMEAESAYRESLIYQQMKTVKYELSNCTLLDYDTTHFDRLLKDIHESVENWQEMNTQLAKLYADQLNDAEKAAKKKEDSKLVN